MSGSTILQGDTTGGPRGAAPAADDAGTVAWLTRLVQATDPGEIARLAVVLARAQPGCVSAQIAWSPFAAAPEDATDAPISPALAMVRGRLERTGLPHVAFGDALAVRLLTRGRAALLLELAKGSGHEAVLAGLAPSLPLIAQKLERALKLRELEAAHRQLARSETLQRALFAIADLAGSSLDMAEVLHQLHGIIDSLMYAENFFIVRCDPQLRTMRFLYYADTQDADAPQLDVDIPLDGERGTLTWHLLTSGRALMGSMEAIRQQLRGSWVPTGPMAVDWLGVPMKREGEVRGALVVQSYRDGVHFAEEDRVLLQFVASHVLTAIERKQNMDELEHRVRLRTSELAEANYDLQQEVVERERAERLQAALFHLAQLATADIGEGEFYRRVHEVVGELINAENFFIALLTEDRRRLQFPYYVGDEDTAPQERELARGLSEYVMRSGQAFLGFPQEVAELSACGEIDKEPIGRPSQCWLGVPLRVDDAVIGLVAVQSYTPEVRYDQADMELLSFAALQIANSIHRRRAAASLQQANAELERRVAERTGELRQEIAERERIQERLRHDVSHDALTGLPNRSYLRERLSQRLAQRRPGARCALLYLDVDRFKVINDSLGHLAGDAFLQEVARRLRHCLQEPDVVARLSGDEFAILLDEVGEPARAEQVAQTVLQSLHQPLWVGGRELEPSASVGIALEQERHDRADALLRDADMALYRAKELGRGRYMLFDETLAQNAVDQLALEIELRHALQHDEFEPYYQPIVHLGSGQVVGHEALLRWNHPRRGLLLPTDFVHIALDSGLLDAIDWKLYGKVCARMAQPDTGDGFVTINVSPQHLRHADFERRLLQLVERSGLAPGRLLLEITEGALLDDQARVRGMFERLRAAGIQTALDDFGTGYSSLSYLHSLPLGKLKIDHSFVSGLDFEGGSGANTVVTAILALSFALGIDVIAEGIETQAQRDVLHAMGCEYGQGFLLGRPSPQPVPASGA